MRRPTQPPSARLAALLLAPLLAACGGGGGGGGGTPPPVAACITGSGPLVTVSGTVVFERLVLSPATGLGALTTRPARWVDVGLVDPATSTCYGQVSADAAGAYALSANPPAGLLVQVVAWSRTDADPLRHVTVHNAIPPGGNVHTNGDCFFFASTVFAAGSQPTVNLTVPWNPGSTVDRPAIGFSVLDILVGCAERIRSTTAETPPLCHGYTMLGNAGATGTSFYNDAAKALTVLGGMAGALDTTDTDYFDDAVVAHEYGHFVEFNMSASRNRGGPHSGEDLEPPFAWSEGGATGWGCALLQNPAYVDSVGTSPNPPQISSSAENWTPQTVRGIGGEETVTELVWDLVDGTPGLVSTDGDGVAVAFGALYAQFLGYDGTQVVPYVGTLLDRAVNVVGVPQATMTALMTSPENQQISYPLAGGDVWPVPLAVPGMASGACDSTTGNCHGRFASVWYAFNVPTQATRTFTLVIGPTGGNGDNLDLTLETFTGAVLGTSAQGGAATEVIGPITLQPGNYVVRVEAVCSGNQATFTLTVS